MTARRQSTRWQRGGRGRWGRGDAFSVLGRTGRSCKAFGYTLHEPKKEGQEKGSRQGRGGRRKKTVVDRRSRTHGESETVQQAATRSFVLASSDSLGNAEMRNCRESLKPSASSTAQTQCLSRTITSLCALLPSGQVLGAQPCSRSCSHSP